jgi:hypothetical protein
MQRSLASRGASAHAQDGKCSTESEFFDNGRICQQDVKSSEIASMILFDAAQFFQKKKKLNEQRPNWVRVPLFFAGVRWSGSWGGSYLVEQSDCSLIDQRSRPLF